MPEYRVGAGGHWRSFYSHEKAVAYAKRQWKKRGLWLNVIIPKGHKAKPRRPIEWCGHEWCHGAPKYRL